MNPDPHDGNIWGQKQFIAIPKHIEQLGTRFFVRRKIIYTTWKEDQKHINTYQCEAPQL
jgi:hypothetical protein